MRYLICFLVLFLGLQPGLFSQTKTGTKKIKKTVRKGKKDKKTFIDLEGLDIQGLIDRPQTLYILKRSKVDFYDSIETYDYIEAIVAPTHKEPF
jgi:hypothetical protein